MHQPVLISMQMLLFHKKCKHIGKLLSKTNYVSIMFPDPPGRPEIQGLDEGEILTAGKLKRLTCISMSGNPLAKLTWYVGVRQVASVYSTVDNYATAELALIPDQVCSLSTLPCPSQIKTQPKYGNI